MPTHSSPAEPAPPMPPGLVHSSDAESGIRRVRRGRRFSYRTVDGRSIRADSELRRIRRLAIPPAYEDVWICTRADGHLQATGRDARGRKQYRYHPLWREQRDGTKFERLQAFAQALPGIRRRLAADLRRDEEPRLQLLAAVVRLLDTTCARIGNAAYARDNGSYGLTTLCRRHARVRGTQIRFEFRGKGGVTQCVEVDDPRLARLVRRCQGLPGQELFRYRDATDGAPRSIGSGDVNAYLQAITRAGFTAKDFRTWHGTELALDTLARALRRAGPVLRLRDLLAEVAALLGNTPAVCRKSYVHPEVLALAARAQGHPSEVAAFIERLREATLPRGTAALRASERLLLAFLRSGPAQ